MPKGEKCTGCGETRKNLLGDCWNLRCPTRWRELRDADRALTHEERRQIHEAEQADADRSEPYGH